MNIKKHIPNAITSGNLLCGCLAIVKAFEGDLVWAAYLVGIAAVLDFFDGFAARMLKVSSPIGKDLDSLADMVTFGVVPGVVMFQLLKCSFCKTSFGFSTPQIASLIETNMFAFTAFIISIFSAIRLAKFNNDSRQSDSFIGLPTPANAILICSLGLISSKFLLVPDMNLDETTVVYPPLSVANVEEAVPDFSSGQFYFHNLLFNEYTLIGITLIFSFLLIAELPLFALKFKHFKWKENEIRFVFLGLSLVMLITLQFVGIPLIIIMYILLSVINNMITKKKAVS